MENTIKQYKSPEAEVLQEEGLPAMAYLKENRPELFSQREQYK